MKRSYTYIGIIIVLVVIVAFGAYAYTHRAPVAGTITATASYLCRDGKTIDATYTANNVALTLSDGRYLTLPQVISGSGIRYEQGAGTSNDVAFLSKGDNAFLLENDTQTFADCVANAATGAASTTTSGSTKTFTDTGKTFSFSYPNNFTVSGGGVGYSQSWMVNATTSGLTLAKATLPRAFQPNTNFSEATLTVGTSADPSAIATCLTYNPSGGPVRAAQKVSINGTAFTKFSSSDAGAGNRYETTSYRTLRNNQCYALEYTIHSTNIGNYDPSQGVKEFDQTSVQNALDGVVNSFKFL